ncbi:MAG: hypothetical protein LBG80_08855 [Bacteroidales bacterium]|nr:hypothetical protein [Bacteroidales bacterium]
MTCHPYGILLTATIFSTDISSLRDLLSATTEQSVTINASLGRDCHVAARLAMTALSVDLSSATTEINAGIAL